MNNKLDPLLKQLNLDEIELYQSLTTPEKVQAFLDGTTYSSDDFNRSPARVLRDKCAHCLDGALFAVACLRQNDYPPLLVDMLPEPGMDDDHLLAVFKRHGLWGAVAKSNFAGLRYREPVYRTIRELVLSYFEQFYNIERVKTLRGYTRPINMQRFDSFGWMGSDSGVDKVEKALYSIKPITLFSAEVIKSFALVDERTYKTGLDGANMAGLYKG